MSNIDQLPDSLRQMITIDAAGCWFPFNKKGRPQSVFWNSVAKETMPIAAFVYRQFVGECGERVQFVRTCGHGDCCNPAHMIVETFAMRLHSYIDHRGEGECWPWVGAKTHDGYGQIAKDGAPVRAHRAAYEHANGPIPDGLLVRHKCNNKQCCNPAHLEVGTHADNAQDSVESGISKRQGRRAGDSAKIAAAIADVRAGMRIVDAARKHGTTRVSVWRNMKAAI
jgi:hypothetical protein